MVARGQVVEQPSKGFNHKDKKRSRNSGLNSGLNTPEPEEGTLTKRTKTEDNINPSSNTGNGESLGTHSSSTENSEGESEAVAEAEAEAEGDSDDDTIDPVRDAVTSKDPRVMGKILLPSDRTFRPRKPCKYFLRGKCTRGDQCTYSHDPSLTVRLAGSFAACSFGHVHEDDISNH